MTKLYIVEDDDNIRELVVYAMQSSGFETEGFESAASFWQKTENSLPDLLLLDIMLPDEDGLSILKRIKRSSKTADLPVILLTAKGAEYDRVKGLDTGADDYITKPFSVLELISRIKAVLRRCSGGSDQQSITIGTITIDPARRVVLSGNKDIDLTFKEFELLHLLCQNRAMVLSRDKIMERVWGFDFEGESRTVDMHIKTLRQKLGEGGEMIKTVRGIGYKIGG